VRGFLVGFVLLVALGLSILSVRRGGLRRQLTFAARRFRLAIALAGVYLLCSAAIRLAAAQGPVADFGPPVLALLLLAVFMVLGQDPRVPAEPPAGPR
jgi:hypothetical protein